MVNPILLLALTSAVLSHNLLPSSKSPSIAASYAIGSPGVTAPLLRKLTAFHLMPARGTSSDPQYPGAYPVYCCDEQFTHSIKERLSQGGYLIEKRTVPLGSGGDEYNVLPKERKDKGEYQAYFDEVLAVIRPLVDRAGQIGMQATEPARSFLSKEAAASKASGAAERADHAMLFAARSVDGEHFPQPHYLHVQADFIGKWLLEGVEKDRLLLTAGVDLDLLWAALAADEGAADLTAFTASFMRYKSERDAHATAAPWGVKHLLKLIKALSTGEAADDLFADRLGVRLAYLALMLVDGATINDSPATFSPAFESIVRLSWFSQAAVLYKQQTGIAVTLFSPKKYMHPDDLDSDDDAVAAASGSVVSPKGNGTHKMIRFELVSFDEMTGERRSSVKQALFMQGCDPEYIATQVLAGDTAPNPRLIKIVVAQGCAFEGGGLKSFLERFKRLEILSLNNCGLVSLPHDLFACAPNLMWLDLSANEIRQVPAGLFASTPQLSRIDLAGNAIVDIADPLDNLPGLVYFSCAHNPLLKRLPDNAFAASKRIKIFNITECRSLTGVPYTLLPRLAPSVEYFLAHGTGLDATALASVFEHSPLLKMAWYPAQEPAISNDPALEHEIAAAVQLRIQAQKLKHSAFFAVLSLDDLVDPAAPVLASIPKRLAGEGDREARRAKEVGEIVKHMKAGFVLDGRGEAMRDFDEAKAKAKAAADAPMTAKFKAEADAECKKLVEANVALTKAHDAALKDIAAKRVARQAANARAQDAATRVPSLNEALETFLRALHVRCTLMWRFVLLRCFKEGKLTPKEYRAALGSYESVDEDSDYLDHQVNEFFDLLFRLQRTALQDPQVAALDAFLNADALLDDDYTFHFMTPEARAEWKELYGWYSVINGLAGLLHHRLVTADPHFMAESAFMTDAEGDACRADEQKAGFDESTSLAHALAQVACKCRKVFDRLDALGDEGDVCISVRLYRQARERVKHLEELMTRLM